MLASVQLINFILQQFTHLKNLINYFAIQRKVFNNQMTSTQVRYGLGNTVSGNLNKKSSQFKHKQIQIDTQDIQMFSPQFLQSKTLKKPLKQYGINLDKTNPQGIKYVSSKVDIDIDQFYNTAKSLKIENQDLKQTKKFQFSVIDSQGLNIKPAYQKKTTDNQKATLEKHVPFQIDDQNTIFSAMLKKGQKPAKKSISFNIPQQNEQTKRQSVKAGPAQNKLKKLFNKSVQVKPEPVIKKEQKNKNKQIQEDINQQISEQYGNQSFQKLSGAYQSAIKQSIRQSLGNSSGGIKQSIKQSIGGSSGKYKNSFIGQDIRQSIRVSQSKDRVSEFIASYKSSGIQEDIADQISGSQRKSNNSIEEIYEDVFQELDESLSRSQSKFKKSVQLKDNDVLSKSFRKKNNVVKSIRLAQQINLQNQEGVDELKKKVNKGSKIAQQILNQKSSIIKKKIDIDNFFKQKDSYVTPNRNKDLLYEFRIQLNKLLTSQNFQSKLRKLTSFINFGNNQEKTKINQLQDKILANLLAQVNQIKKPQSSNVEIQKLRVQYDQKLNRMLKTQQISLKVQMDKKLQQKDMQLKKMMAELQKKFQGKIFSSGAKFNNFIDKDIRSEQFQIQSDYSIDSQNISWKADLWQALPEYEKKKLYERQTIEVTKFLTNVMMNQLKEESLDRSLDISFQFPDNLSASQQTHRSSSGSLPSLGIPKKNATKQQEPMLLKAAFNRKQLQEKVGPLKSQSWLPDIPRSNSNKAFQYKKQNVNQYAKQEGQVIIESIKKRSNLKQEVIQCLSSYKSTYLKKKNDTIRKLLKTLLPKKNQKILPQNFASLIQQTTILNEKDIIQKDLLYVKAYQEQLLWSLMNIYSKCQIQNKKPQAIQEQMRRQFDRLVVVCQVKTAQNCVECINIEAPTFKLQKQPKLFKEKIAFLQTKALPIQIVSRDEHLQIVDQKQKKIVKDELVNQIMNLLMGQFSKQFPKRKK